MRRLRFLDWLLLDLSVVSRPFPGHARFLACRPILIA